MNKSNARTKVFYLTSIGASADSFLTEHLTQLSSNGFDISLVCTPDVRAKRAAKRSAVELIPANIRTDISPLADFFSIISLFKIFARHRPHVVHAHMSKAGMLGCFAAFLGRVPVRIYHNHGMAYFSATGLKRFVLGFAERVACSAATHVIFCSQSTMDAALRSKVCCSKKSLILGGGTISGVDQNLFSKTLSRSELVEERKKLGLEDCSVVVGFVGRIVAHKGIQTIIDSWGALPSSIKDNTALIFAGSNYEDSLYSRLIAFVNEHPNARYLGRVDNVKEVYQIIDILVLPSFHEGFPYSVLEAQCLGIPAIVTKVTGNVDAIEDGVTGSYVPVNDSEALAEEVARLVKNESLRNDFSLAARRRVLDKYTQIIAMENLLKFYCTLKVP